jgi:FkbM family methyltransferase
MTTSLLGRKPVPVKYEGEKFLVNPEAATAYHLLNSIDKIRDLVKYIPSGNNQLILDVGANCGIFSLLARRRFPDSEIYAFEPSARLKKILEENFTSRNITLVPKAVTNYNGYINYFVNPQSEQTNSVVESSISEFAQAFLQESVECISLSSFLHELGREKVDVLKLDVQGAESLIVKDLKENFQNIKNLIVEVVFFDENIFELIDSVRALFPYYKFINPVYAGADLFFSKQPL